MYVPSHVGSIRSAALLGAYRREHKASLATAQERMTFLDSITIIKPSEIAEEEWDPPTVAEALADRHSGLRIRRGNKFASVEKCFEELEYYDGLMTEHQKEMSKIHVKLARLIGSDAASKTISKIEAANLVQAAGVLGRILAA